MFTVSGLLSVIVSVQTNQTAPSEKGCLLSHGAVRFFSICLLFLRVLTSVLHKSRFYFLLFFFFSSFSFFFSYFPLNIRVSALRANSVAKRLEFFGTETSKIIENWWLLGWQRDKLCWLFKKAEMGKWNWELQWCLSPF